MESESGQACHAKLCVRSSQPTLHGTSDKKTKSVEWGKGQGQDIESRSLSQNRPHIGKFFKAIDAPHSPHSTRLYAAEREIGRRYLKNDFVDSSCAGGHALHPFGNLRFLIRKEVHGQWMRADIDDVLDLG